jgi:Leucine-rich repeat (LRR) protein
MWRSNDFNKWNNEGRPINETVIYLDISDSNIEILGRIENLINLKTINCYGNQLTSLEGIENLVNLTFLRCNNNQLTLLEGIENCVNLNILYCNNNQLTSLEGIENLVNLEYLDYENNQLTSLEGIDNLINLKHLSCNNNQLTSLEGIENLVKLIKNNKQIKNHIKYDFIDSDDYIELNDLFKNLIKCDDDKIYEYIENIIKELNGFQKYVLK